MIGPLPVRKPLVTRDASRGYNNVSGDTAVTIATMADAALVAAVLAGDPDAFTRLVDRHSGPCLRFATRMLGDVQDAEDVTQEAFLRAYAALNRYDGTASFQTWLMSILVNRCRTALLTRKRRDARVIIDETLVGAASVSDAGGDAALRDAIERALTRLDPAQREAFLLKHVEQLSYDEIAAMTGTGVSALKMRVQRACERLQTLLQEDRHD
jgi:RNA polymerase sigma-70 factor, ECF subfamily